MPIYEYACGKCGVEFEVEQRISDDPVRTCPECRSRKVKRLISRTSFVLKGSGWYSDLYSSKQDAAKPGAEKSDAGSSDAGGKTSDGEKPAKSDSGKVDSGKPDSGSKKKSETKGKSKAA